jgi:lipoprotein-anchoring transpeptidase ErfK/SrfK
MTTSTPTPRRRPRRSAAAGAGLLLALALAGTAGCGGGSPTAAGPDPTTAPSPTSTDTDNAGEAGDQDAAGTATVARASGPVDVFAAPGDDDPTMTLPATTGFGSPRALLVVDRQEGWLEVALPVRPNGSSGWIRTDGLDQQQVHQELVVDLAERELTLLADGEPVMTSPVAIGTSEFPTPTGRFYVVDKLDTGGGGPYGPFALGLSGYSDVLTEFGGGDGQVGIHGTDDPATIGQAVSHGCVRVPNAVISELAGLLPLGTPVTVV